MFQNSYTGFKQKYPENPFWSYLVTNVGDNQKIFTLPPEKVVKAYNDFSGVQFSFVPPSDGLQIVYFFPDPCIDFNYIIQAVSIINQLFEASFTLYVYHDLYNEILPFCNDHIIVKKIGYDLNLSIESNLIITYGLSTIHFLRNKIPVLVLGPFGFGGFVTPTNLHFLYKSDFMGRAGGIKNERIPIEIVAHEIGFFKDIKEIDALLTQNKSIADALPINCLSKELKLQESLNEIMQETFKDKEKRNYLKPKLCSNMHMIFLQDRCLIRRAIINDTICTFDKVEALFLQDLNGRNTCLQLMIEYRMGEETFWDLITLLMAKQIITLIL